MVKCSKVTSSVNILFTGLLLFIISICTQAQIEIETFQFVEIQAGRTDISQHQLWQVPVGVTSISIIARGASGGAGNILAGGCLDALGGKGAVATGNDIPVIPGDILIIVVGGAGTDGNCVGADDGGDGGGGGGSGVYNTAGGGITLIVAGGGGGAGGANTGNLSAGQDGLAMQGVLGNGGAGSGGGAAGAAGGGGALGPGIDGPGMGVNAAKGGAQGETSGGDGGAAGQAAAPNGASRGGFGFGGGGGAGKRTGAGGGGATGGAAGISRGGQGGQSYVSPSAASMGFGVANEMGNGNVIIYYMIPGSICESFEFNEIILDRTDISEPQIWKVPFGVHTVSLIAIGGSGGTGNITAGGCPDVNGGKGAKVIGSNIPVFPGQELNIIVGGAGKDGNCDGGDGGGGGGSGIYKPADSGSTLVVAGGGGGGGGANTGNVSPGLNGIAMQGTLGPGGPGAGAIGSGGAAGGGGANGMGGPGTGGGPDAATGGESGIETGGNGGAAGLTASPNGASTGGYGFGGGGGAGKRTGAGGGGATGGAAGTSGGGEGGQSYVSPFATAFVFDHSATMGNGSIKIIYTIEKPIPTLSQWGLILLSIIFIILGIVAARQEAIAV